MKKNFSTLTIEKANLRYCKIYLQKKGGYEVFTAYEMGWRSITKQSSKKVGPDLIILDLMLPKLKRV